LRWTRLRLVAALLAVLLLGLLAVRWAVRRHDHFLREELLRKTYIVAQAVPLDRVLALKGDRSDEERTEYRRLKTQLITAAQIEPAWKWIYLMGRNADGEVFFQMDSEAFDAEDPSPPGQVYPEASPLLHRVFETGAAATEGPLPDRWGVWVSAFVPLKDAASGRLVTVVGVDIEAGTWRLQTWRAGLVPGLSVMPLHEFDGVSTALVRWAPQTRFNTHTHPGGEEIFVLDGLFQDEAGDHPAGTWLRSPRWSRHTPFTGSEGALIYVKVGHLGAPFLTPA